MSERKLAIVMSGGGTRSVYGAGALLAIAEQYGLTDPEVMVAESGSVLSSMYYLARQYPRMVAGWINIPGTPGFISSVRRPFINLDIMEQTLRDIIPLDTVALAVAKTLLYVPLTRVRDGAVVYHRLSRDENPYELLRAAEALPIFYGKRVPVGGELYVDGGFGAHLDDHVQYALDLGATHVIVIQSSNGPGSLMRRLYQTAGMLWRREGLTGLASAAQHEIAVPRKLSVPSHVKMVRIAPTRTLPVSLNTKAKAKLRAAFDLGYADTVASGALREFFS
jgi:predicted patatin/cPLA2 family phospholipase